MVTKYNDVDWPDPWYEIIDQKQRAHLTDELHRKVMEGHSLSGKSTSVVARRDDRDDVLVEIDNDNHLYAQVHLTWSKTPEADTQWPMTVLFRSFEEWKEAAS